MGVCDGKGVNVIVGVKDGGSVRVGDGKVIVDSGVWLGGSNEGVERVV
jgi:hypothetical protein